MITQAQKVPKSNEDTYMIYQTKTKAKGTSFEALKVGYIRLM